MNSTDRTPNEVENKSRTIFWISPGKYLLNKYKIICIIANKKGKICFIFNSPIIISFLDMIFYYFVIIKFISIYLKIKILYSK